MNVTAAADRLVLRPLAAEDSDFYVGVYTDPALMAAIGTPLSLAAAGHSVLAALRGNDAGPGSRYRVILDGAGQRRIGLVGHRLERGSAELGVIVLPAWQGRGLARAALTVLIARLHETTTPSTFVIRHRLEHGAMAAIARRLGFSPAATDGQGMRVWALAGNGAMPRSRRGHEADLVRKR